MTSPPMMSLKPPTDDREFDEMMRAVDNALRLRGLLPYQRPIRAWFEISRSLNLGLSLRTANRVPKPGVFTGEDMTIRIFNWYDDQYGQKLGLRWGLARTVVLIREEPWAVTFPKVWGNVRFVVDMNDPKTSSSTLIGRHEPPTHNILDSIQGLPDGLRWSLTTREQSKLISFYRHAFEDVNNLAEHLTVGMCPEVLSDLETSVENLVGRSPHYGQSKWASLQAAEKVIKTFIASVGGSYEKNHKLQELALVAASLGLPRIPPGMLRKVECSANVRYGEIPVSLNEAHEAHISALRVVGITTARTIKPRT